MYFVKDVYKHGCKQYATKAQLKVAVCRSGKKLPNFFHEADKLHFQIFKQNIHHRRIQDTLWKLSLITRFLIILLSSSYIATNYKIQNFNVMVKF